MRTMVFVIGSETISFSFNSLRVALNFGHFQVDPFIG